MNKVLKFIIFLLSMIGVVVIWQLLNNLSDGNILNIGIGDYILILIGLRAIMNKIGDIVIGK